MAKADLTAQRLRELLHYDPQTGSFTRRSDGRVLGCKSKHLGYWIVGVSGGQYYAHRLAWFYTHGRWPEGHIDHINCDKTDNRLENLREVQQRINNQN